MLLLLVSALFWPTAYAENNVPIMTKVEGDWPGELYALMLDTKSTFDDLVIINDGAGVLMCLEASTGRPLYNHVFAGSSEADTPRRLEPVLRRVMQTYAQRGDCDLVCFAEVVTELGETLQQLAEDIKKKQVPFFVFVDDLDRSYTPYDVHFLARDVVRSLLTNRGQTVPGETLVVIGSRAETAAAKLMPSSASAMLPTTRALARMSCAPLAKATASGSCAAFSKRGVTSTRSLYPMVFMARATAPILPARLVSTRINRSRVKRFVLISGRFI